MSVTVIILGILLVVLIYVLYLYLSPTSASLVTSASLLTNTPAITKIENPTSPRYAYGLWLYVNSWNNNEKIVFSRYNNIKLTLDKSQLNLYADVFMGTSGGKWLSEYLGNPAGAGILITDNFPLQKWCYIILSVDNNFLDCYLDGKLLLSQKLYVNTSGTTTASNSATSYVSPTPPPDMPSATGGAAIILGGSDGGMLSQPVYKNFDAAVNGFTRWPNAINPQIAWDSYMLGNGTTVSKFSSFNAKLNILKNNSAYSTLSLF
jgi:hypothetical protein